MSRRTRTPAALCLYLLLASRLGTAAPAAVPAGAPKLVVLLVVDQMRGDYFGWYGAAWKGGLRRLFDKGAWFMAARYPYLNTVTCPGHATIGTGAYPHRHGMITNTWYDRPSKKVIDCTSDPGAPLIAYGPGRLSTHDSARNLLVPTLGDELQAQFSPRSRVVGFSMKARATINLTGHKPDVALWFEGGTWVTSTAFTDSPTPWVQAFARDNLIPPAVETPWTKLLPDKAYKFQDDASGEKPPLGWTTTFPHPLKGRGAGIGRFGNSPVADDFLGRLARTALTQMKLGQTDTVDLLAVSFSMTDLVGHAYGPRSHEVQDVLARLDLTVGQLLAALDEQVGPANYVLALSADHGVAVIPEQTRSEGHDAGRVATADVKALANETIADVLGGSRTSYVADMQGNDLYLADGVRDRLLAKPGALAKVLTAIRTVPGIEDAFDSDEIKDVAHARDAVRKAAALGYYPGRSGDILIAPKRDWVVSSSLGTNHGSINDYDQRVPLVLFGKRIKPGKYTGAASPADIAPTLAAIVGIKLPQAEGKALGDAIVPEEKKPEPAAPPASPPKDRRGKRR